MATYVFIPARYSSTRLPGKPLLKLAGKSLLRWVYEGCSRSLKADNVIIATDDERIREEAESFGASVVLTSSEHLSGTDRIAEAAEKYGCRDEDVIINVQGDEPTVDGQIVDDLITACVEYPEFSIITLAYRSKSKEEFLNPNTVKVVFDNEMRALYFSRAPIPHVRDDTSDNLVWWKHLGFYGYRYGFLKTFVKLPPGKLEQLERLEQLRALERGYSVKILPSSRDTISIDTPDDVEEFLRYLKNKK
ncbi:3-deoxy-manno-octulosonate cytidylyltransferase [Thermodesulforhabdus norvegica]|uniref:3-deoxy-manno-octulosonate cytidylyltransferase n=1 Tax=Thermodesulforhabdus norvegica TaxID=39841 RepID=A0A1I4RA85_9BACT|nr:3-deoxy-manno-octulosonate cytidylyltransferase [Thermodesulforhabdus norvegica]SFM49182.1 3-deoxy-manno-octulosonate cytidylyltransferase (CMP-KDO synthetase) [Thermodesulforhabdus norvegica]